MGADESEGAVSDPWSVGGVVSVERDGPRWMTDDVFFAEIGTVLDAGVGEVRAPGLSWYRFDGRWWRGDAVLEELAAARGVLRRQMAAVFGRPVEMPDGELDMVLVDEGWVPGGDFPEERVLARLRRVRDAM